MAVLFNDITERKQTDEALRRELERAQLLHQLSTELIQADNIEALYEKMLDTAVAVLRSDFASLQVLQTEGAEAGKLRLLGYRGFSPQTAKFWEWVSPSSDSACGMALRTKQRVFVRDVRQCEFMAGTQDLTCYLDTGVVAVLTTPLVSRSGDLLGVFSTHWREAHEPTDGELRTVDVLARQAADLLERRRDEGRARAELDAMKRLRSLGALFVREGNLESVLGEIVETDKAICGSDFGNIQLLDEATGRLGIATHRGLPKWWLDYWGEVQEGQGTCGMALARRERVIIEDVEKSPIFVGTPGLEVQLKAGVRAVQSTPLVSRAGRPLGMFSTHWSRPHRPDERVLRLLDLLAQQGADIIERTRYEEALRNSEEQLRRAIEEAPIPVIMHAEDGQVLQLSRTWTELTGYRAEEIPTFEAWLNRAYGEGADEVRRHVQGLFAGHQQTIGIEFPVRRADGQLRHWSFSASSPGTLQDGRRYVVGMAVDITEKNEVRAVLARDKDELARLVAERTEKLQEMVGELEHFSYTITHDLKAPLRAMRGFAEIASGSYGDGNPGQAMDALGKISTSAERMERLIADALNYSRTMQQDVPLTDVDTGALLRGILDSYPDLQPPKAYIQVEGNLPVVLANEAGLTQCLSNLLGNAVKFVRPGERPEIRVWAEQQDGCARILVEDKGIGISREMLPRVFDMFSRGSKDYDGTGIGLALVQKVMQRMGGRVGVESEEGKGSRFWIELKLGQVQATPERADVVPPQPVACAVLYVEDEEADAMFMQMAFAKKGMESSPYVVGDGRAALEYLAGTGKYADRTQYPSPSLVLLDLNLPQVPGFDVLKWIRTHPDFARTPVVVFSSSTREDDRVKALELGANDSLPKPSSGLKFGVVVEALQQKWLKAGA